MLFKFLPFMAIILLLSSCAVTEEKQPIPASSTISDGFSAWRLTSSERVFIASNRAVAKLLQQADELMAASSFVQSSDKLERLVRIEPQFAQAWSRLAWIALNNGDAKRSHQFSQRSNSYSRDNINLKVLNWRFIQKAGELLNDVNIIENASKMIQSLSEK